jgi:hypothetical protein
MRRQRLSLRSCSGAQCPDLAQRDRNAVSVVVSGACQGRVTGGADSGRMRNSAIAVSGLRKAYGDKIVLDGIDLDVRAGTVFPCSARMGRVRRRR